MVNVDPNDYDKYQDMDKETKNTAESKQTAPLYTITVLENESIDVIPSSGSSQNDGFRSDMSRYSTWLLFMLTFKMLFVDTKD